MIFIRADANESIGSGHVMRCLSIAKAVSAKGVAIKFITADHKGDALIQEAGFSSVCLCSDFSCMEDELSALIRLIGNSNPELLLIDSYYITNEYFRRLLPFTKVAYINDLNCQAWDVDILINYNIYSEILDYSAYADSETRLLLSPLYAPLREEFKGLPEHEIKKSVTDIMVSAGGADPKRISEHIMRNICPCLPDVKFHFIIGALNPRVEDLRKLEKDNITLHINEKKMSELMKTCDIAVSAAGSTLYELCACGLPTITYTIADNQLAAAERFEEMGIMINAGDCRGNDRFIPILDECIKTLLSRSVRKTMSEKMQTLVDGNGADRIAEVLVRI